MEIEIGRRRYRDIAGDREIEGDREILRKRLIGRLWPIVRFTE